MSIKTKSESFNPLLEWKTVYLFHTVEFVGHQPTAVLAAGKYKQDVRNCEKEIVEMSGFGEL